ncbi:MAG TPA: hypothetical protein VM529_25090 [Gemmata sp.]|nr:hypothetical protein [Gemmata sp.]
MADNVDRIAAKLGAAVVGHVPEAAGGAFGASKVLNDVAQLRANVLPVRVSGATREQLERLAERASVGGQKVDTVEVAARLLEEAAAAADAAG